MNGPTRLAQVFVELADTLVEEFDVVELMQILIERCVELLQVDAAGLMLADQRGTLQLMASTGAEAQSLELFELQHDEGPCLESFATGQPITNVSLSEAAERWPHFSPFAVEAGFSATHALPMRLRKQVIGSLNLFTRADIRLGDIDISVGQALADIATIGLLHERNLREKTVLSEQLQGALQTRVLIEQAKGVVAARAGVTVAEAFARMRTYARHNGLTLTSVAAGIIDGAFDVRVLATS